MNILKSLINLKMKKKDNRHKWKKKDNRDYKRKKKKKT